MSKSKPTPLTRSTIVRIGAHFQVTIPSSIREVVPVQIGEYVEVSVADNVIAIKPVEIVVKKTSKKKAPQRRGHGINPSHPKL